MVIIFGYGTPGNMSKFVALSFPDHHSFFGIYCCGLFAFSCDAAGNVEGPQVVIYARVPHGPFLKKIII